MTSPAALACSENAPHHIVWSAWHSVVMPLSGRLYSACVCWRQWHHADRGSLELSIDACFVKIGQGDHLFRLLCGLSSCFSTCSVHCRPWKRRFLDSTASVGLIKRSLSGVCSDKRFGAVCFCFGRVGRKRASVGRCMCWWNGRKTQATTSLERSAVALEFPCVSFWQGSTRLTTPQRRRRTVHRNYLWAMVCCLRLAVFIKDAQGLTWGVLYVCHGSQRWGHVGSSKACTAILTFFFFFSSISSTPWALEC